MSSKSSLLLISYKDQLLTQEEIALLKFYENRLDEKKRALEAEQKKITQMYGLKNPPQQEKKRFSSLKPNICIEDKYREPEKQPTAKELSIWLPQTPPTPDEDKFPILYPKTFSSSAELEIAKVSAGEDLAISQEYKTSSQDITSLKRYKKKKTDSAGEEVGREVEHESTIEPDYSSMELLLSEDWSPEANVESEKPPPRWVLKDFGLQKNQTLIAKVTVPESSLRWSINIGPPDPYPLAHEDPDEDLSSAMWTEILCHVNPRQSTKFKGLLLNNRVEGLWGSPHHIPPTSLPRMSGVSMELCIQVVEGGFVLLINNKCIAEFPHRSDVSSFETLQLELPLADDNGYPENVIFHKVWWGKRDLLANVDFKSIGDKVPSYATDTVFLSDLPPISDAEVAQELESHLWDIFDAYEPVSVTYVMNKSIAFVKVASTAAAYKAVLEMPGYIIQDASGDVSYSLKVAFARSRQQYE